MADNRMLGQKTDRALHDKLDELLAEQKKTNTYLRILTTFRMMKYIESGEIDSDVIDKAGTMTDHIVTTYTGKDDTLMSRVLN